MTYSISVAYKVTELVWGRREREYSRKESVSVGERFWVWETREEEGGVRFSLAQPYSFTDHYEAEGFFLPKGEKRAVRAVIRSTCAEDCIEDILEGTAELTEAEDR